MDRRRRPQLTQQEVEAAKTKDGNLNMLSDGANLYLQVRKGETKHWIVKYKDPDTREQRSHRVGTWPTVSAGKARLLRDRVLEMVRRGINPNRYKDSEYVMTSDIEKKISVDYTHDLIYTRRMIF